MAEHGPLDRVAALVTGGAKRIGRAIVETLAADGHPIAIHCNGSRHEADALAASIVAHGGSATVVQGDLARLDTLENLVAAAESALGPLGLLVNNASLFANDEAPALNVDGLSAHWAINVAAPCLLASAFAKRLPASSTGLVVNIIDQRVLKPTPHYFSYSLSKSGLWWATRTLAQALAPRIRVVGIGPGPTLRNTRQDKAAFDRQAAAVLLGHGPDLVEIGRTVRWVRDTPSMTGQLILLDGGQHLAWETPDVMDVGEHG